MIANGLTRLLAATAALALAACASAPPPATPAPAEPATDTAQTAPAGQKHYKWSKATEAEVAAALDKKFAEAAKAYVQLKRDDQVMFCKKYREIGSSIRTLHCITEAELRKQVEDSDEARDQMRRKMGRCDLTSGCGAGPDPVSKYPTQ